MCLQKSCRPFGRPVTFSRAEVPKLGLPQNKGVEILHSRAIDRIGIWRSSESLKPPSRLDSNMLGVHRMTGGLISQRPHCKLPKAPRGGLNHTGYNGLLTLRCFSPPFHSETRSSVSCDTSVALFPSLGRGVTDRGSGTKKGSLNPGNNVNGAYATGRMSSGFRTVTQIHDRSNDWTIALPESQGTAHNSHQKRTYTLVRGDAVDEVYMRTGRQHKKDYT